MAIRIRDNQNLISNQVKSFAGATSFTWQMRLFVEQVTSGGEALFFGGRYYQMFSLRFAGASGATTVPISVGVTRADGHLNMPQVNIPRGRACFLTCTYDGSALRLYLNCILVGAFGGSSAPVSSSGPIVLGVDPTDSQTRDYHVGDIRVWRNVVLTEAQMREARDGLPFTIDPGPPFLDWTCAGPGGTNVTPGAAGVSSPGIAAATVTNPRPQFSDLDLAFVPYARIKSAVIGPSRKTLILRFEDSLTGAEVRPTALVSDPIVTADGEPVLLRPPIWAANQIPTISYPLDAPLAPGADVRLSAPVGWVIAGTIGEARAENGLEVAIPTSLLQPIPEPVSMRVGWNLGDVSAWGPVSPYANLMKRAQPVFVKSVPEVSITIDPKSLFPSNVEGGYAYCTPVVFPNATHDSRGYPTVPSGDYTLLWDGPGDAKAEQQFPGHSFVQTSSDLAGPTGKRRTYRLTLSQNPAHSRSPQIRVGVSGRIENVRLYGPGTPVDGSAKFHPDYLRMLGQPKALRFMDATGTNTSSLANYSDVATPSYFTHDYDSAMKTISSSVVSIGPYANPGSYFFTDGRAFLLVTTSAPHGFTTGQCVRFDNLSGGPAGNGRVRLVSGVDIDLMVPTQFVPTPCLVVSDTTFAIAVGANGATGAAAQPAGTQTITGSARVQIKPGMPFEDCVELANLASADPWICVPHAFSDEACAALAADLASALGPGRRMYIEYTNEHWNFAAHFQQSYHNHGQAMLNGLSDSANYAKRAGEVHAIFAAALASAGRPGDLVRVFGSQAGNPGVTTEIVNYCAPRGIPIDAIALAPYFQTLPGVFPDRWLGLDVDQLHDLSDLAVLRHRGTVTRHWDILTPKFPNAKIVCYEGGMELGIPNQNYGSQGNQLQAAAMSRAWSRHPRVRGTVLQYCLNLEQEGCDLFVYFRLAGGFVTYSNLASGAVWAAYQRTGEPAGLGDGSDGLFDNRTAPQDMSNVVSVVGGAVNEWLSLSRKEAGGNEEGRGTSSAPKPITPRQMRKTRASSRPGR